ncbi:MAG: PDR/VanB family oxidoreductase [Geminicoccaceae bacterium]|nr:PDR/VanB family oxidoreductase [Geminicoccaceae bacterium]
MLRRIGAGKKAGGADEQTLVVVDRRLEAEGVVSFRLESTDGEPLPAFSPGSHLDIHLENGLARQYSICSDPADLSHYRIAVLLDPRSRGGSSHIHATWRPETRITASRPRNTFELVDSDRRLHLFAGGIGITPLLPMIMALKRSGRDFTLHYYAKTRAHAAFVDLLPTLVPADRLFLYFSRTGGRRIEAGRLLACIPPTDYVYCCGPAGLIESMRSAAATRAPELCRFERFSRTDGPLNGESRPFEVLLAQSGEIFTVPENKSLLETLEERGHAVAFSCREGLCGACQVPYTEGDVVHRDQILDDTARCRMMASCVSRARGHLVLDL